MIGPPRSGDGIQSCTEGLAAALPSQTPTSSGKRPRHPLTRNSESTRLRIRPRSSPLTSLESRATFPIEPALSGVLTMILSDDRAICAIFAAMAAGPKAANVRGGGAATATGTPASRAIVAASVQAEPAPMWGTIWKPPPACAAVNNCERIISDSQHLLAIGAGLPVCGGPSAIT
jgi:hypothetical protein